MKEDITHNITHSRKVLARIHKNRKIAWGIGKIKELINEMYEHENLISNSMRSKTINIVDIWKTLKKISGVKSNVNKYYLYIV